MDILTSIISIITRYTVEPVGRQVGYLIHYKRNFENLRRKLENLDAAKDRMKHMVDEDGRKGKKVHTDVQKWQAQAHKMIQEANKLLDDEDHAKTKCFCRVCPNLVSYHQLSRKSAKLAKKIELNEKVEFPSVSYNARLEEIFDTPSEDYMAFESRISMVNKIMAELRNPVTNLVGVYGIGGVGKSTLVQEVYRQAKTEKLFDDVVLVLDVKQFPEDEKKERIQKKIAEKLDMDVQESQDMEARAKHLWNRIKDKKSLVILDDVWEAINLEDLGIRPMATCKILLTSRDLVSEMRTQKVFRLDVLGEKESWSLFEKMAGEVVKDDPIKKVATQISKKCGGLPVLVVAVASALRSCTTLEVWKDALRRFKSFDQKGLTEKAYLAIEWSYNRLDREELQPLFLLCGVIAGGSCSILLSDLLKYDMGLGLVKNVDTVEEARNALHSLAKKLKDSCLLLDSYDDRKVRMHELVRDVAIWIASKDKHAFSRAYGDEVKEWPDRDSLKKYTAISLKFCKIPRLPEVPWVCPKLRFFLLANHNVDDSLEIPGNYFEGMKELKVLDVTRLRIPSLPPSLQSLTNLQTLCLDHCVLVDIALVGQLTNLKILSLLNSKVKELPKEIGQLTRLQLLDLRYCSELVLISPGVISSLTSLEDLRMGSFKEWEGGLNDGGSNAGVSELKQLHLLTALEIYIPDAKLLPANMFSDTRLERYTILIGDCWLTYPIIYGTSSNMLKLKLTTTSQFGQGIKLLLKICEDLDLDGMKAANIISYILASDSGEQLKNLHVQNNDEVTSLINSSHAFPILESLSLYNLVNLETVCCGQLIAQPFRKLRSLTLRNLPKLIGFSSKGSRAAVTTKAEEIISENEISGPTKLFMKGEVLIPNLTSLVVDGCGGLRFLFSSSMARSLVQLKNLTISNCQIMEEIVPTYESSEEDTDHNMFSQLQDLKLEYLPNLTRFCSARRSINFHSLKMLYLKDCSKLETFIFDPMSTISTINKATEEIRDPIENIRTDAQYFLFDEKVMLPNLTTLIMHQCDGLRFLFSFSMARSLVQLRHLGIASCQIMEEIVTKIGSSEENTNDIFPKLKHLQLQYLPSLTRFCSGSYVEFPSLELLHLEDCSELGVFIFHSKSENVTVGKQTEETDVQYFLLDEKVGFPSLESLMIYDMPKLRTIWHCQLAPGSFRKLKSVRVSGCDSLINIFAPSMMGRLNTLYTLVTCQCKSLQVVFDVGVVLGVEEAYGTLRNQLKTFGCPNLDYVQINSCESLKNIFPASVAKGLQQLRELNVWDCEILEEIVVKEGVETTPIEEFVFPKVTSLTFENLPQLRSFYLGLHVSEWPLLKYMACLECGKVEIFASEYSRFQERLDSGNPIKQPLLLVDKGNPFPNLETLSLDENTEIWYEAHGPLPAELFINLKAIAFSCALPQSFHLLRKLHNLEKLDVYGGPWKEIFVYEGTSSGEIDAVGTTLPHIKNLSLTKMEELMHLGNDNSESIFPNLEILEVYDCGKLKNLTSSAISFYNLTTLHVDGCMGLKYLVNYSVAKCLHQLETLEVQSCESITEIVACKGDEEDSGNYYEIAFSSLQHLVLSDLPSPQGFCSSGNCTIKVLSLNSLIVEKCLIELKISLDGSLIQSSSRPERLQIIK